MKRWFQYKEATGTSSAYTQKVLLRCGLCLPPPSFRLNYQYQTTCLRALIQHYRNEHAENFVSVESVKLQTGIWHDEWIRRTKPGPYLVNVTWPHQRPNLFLGITS